MSDSEAAKNYLLDPLNGPVPSEETGLNSHFRSTFDNPSQSKSKDMNVTTKSITPPIDESGHSVRTASPSLGSRNPFRQSIDGAMNAPSSSRHSGSYPSPPTSATYRKEAFASHAEVSPRQRASLDSPRSPTFSGQGNRSRAGSLGERFPGDKSGQPLDTIRRDHQRAQRAPHLKKRHIPGADTVDELDHTMIGGAYHHEGPYDATLLARNTSYNSSPVAATFGTNTETLKATPRENVLDAIEKHKPLDGTALIPSGERDGLGRRYNYREGENMMIDLGGNYKRWPGVDYKPDDIKGKGEPSFTIEKALKEKEQRDRQYGHHSASEGMELVDRGGRQSTDSRGGRQSIDATTDHFHGQGSPRQTQLPASAIASGTSGVTRSSSTNQGERRTSLDGLKRRIGSIRKKFDHNDS